ncbi:hypothetical protein C5Y97_25280 [Blastopirellula marina]|uniref:Uncharacterized protein n=1 Tax=Blastopirellula marina TaxID=124 RepID=A0A2S8F7S4_9BACT|nr:hypothetical protein C5Y98_25265 [Blastopirellula marina]PTL41752.1 hypothetical protein C5Y97_25280 [Blastopirellula marina]
MFEQSGRAARRQFLRFQDDMMGDLVGALRVIKSVIRNPRENKVTFACGIHVQVRIDDRILIRLGISRGINGAVATDRFQ